MYTQHVNVLPKHVCCQYITIMRQNCACKLGFKKVNRFLLFLLLLLYFLCANPFFQRNLPYHRRWYTQPAPEKPMWNEQKVTINLYSETIRSEWCFFSYHDLVSVCAKQPEVIIGVHFLWQLLQYISDNLSLYVSFARNFCIYIFEKLRNNRNNIEMVVEQLKQIRAIGKVPIVCWSPLLFNIVHWIRSEVILRYFCRSQVVFPLFT